MIPPARGTASPMACTMGNTAWALLKYFMLREVDVIGTASVVWKSMGAEVLPKGYENWWNKRMKEWYLTTYLSIKFWCAFILIALYPEGDTNADPWKVVRQATKNSGALFFHLHVQPEIRVVGRKRKCFSSIATTCVSLWSSTASYATPLFMPVAEVECKKWAKGKRWGTHVQVVVILETCGHCPILGGSCCQWAFNGISEAHYSNSTSNTITYILCNMFESRWMPSCHLDKVR